MARKDNDARNNRANQLNPNNPRHSDNRANQLNPNNPRHSDNRANQLNPNNDAYWQARGCPKRPADWQERLRRERK